MALTKKSILKKLVENNEETSYEITEYVKWKGKHKLDLLNSKRSLTI